MPISIHTCIGPFVIIHKSAMKDSFRNCYKMGQTFGFSQILKEIEYTKKYREYE